MHKNILIVLLAIPVLFLPSTQAAPVMKSPLSGAQTVTSTTVTPTVTIPVTGLVSGALGTATFRLSPDRKRLSYLLSVYVFPTSPIFMAHIHLGPLGANGPVVFWLYGDPGLAPQNSPVPASQFPVNNGPFTGQISGVLTEANFVPSAPQGVNTGVSTFDEAVQNILAGNAYTNVHTTTYPNGEIRGQISGTKQSQ